MWLEETTAERINMMRTEDIIDADIDIVATACPFCLQMLEEGVKKKNPGESIRVMDICELFQKNLMEDNIS